jgi:hypothetical protein
VDNSIDPNGEIDNGDIPVVLDTLTIDGTNPKVGDSVDLKVQGRITEIKNATAFVKAETVNDQPLPSEQKDQPDDKEALMAMAGAADASGGGY